MDDQLAEFLDWRLSDSRYDTELWEFEYDLYQFLKNVPDNTLDLRYQHLCRNVTHLVTDLRDQVPIRAHYLSSWWWLRKLNLTLREYHLRNRAPPRISDTVVSYGNHRVPICLPRYPNACDFVIRYSEEQWLMDFIKRGIVRIAPASSYKGEILDEARQDDELNKHRYQRGDLTKVTTQDGREIPIIGDLKRTVFFSTNYYVLCTSNEHDTRLFPAFPNGDGKPADACAIIWDVDEFVRRLQVAARKRLEGWYFHHNPVAYYDPYEVKPKEKIDPGMSKDFLYAYQREYRFLWVPVSGGTATEALFIELGALDDIASLYRSDGTLVEGFSTPDRRGAT